VDARDRRLHIRHGEGGHQIPRPDVPARAPMPQPHLELRAPKHIHVEVDLTVLHVPNAGAARRLLCREIYSLHRFPKQYHYSGGGIFSRTEGRDRTQRMGLNLACRVG
jgi:hypothetical protein